MHASTIEQLLLAVLTDVNGRADLVWARGLGLSCGSWIRELGDRLIRVVLTDLLVLINPPDLLLTIGFTAHRLEQRSSPGTPPTISGTQLAQETESTCNMVQ